MLLYELVFVPISTVVWTLFRKQHFQETFFVARLPFNWGGFISHFTKISVTLNKNWHDISRTWLGTQESAIGKPYS